MSASDGCAELRELAPELALGIADGEDRALALEHLAGCAECRDHLEDLSRTADELLLLAPLREPPEGFESRVAARMRPAPAPSRRRRPLRLLIPAFAGAAVAALAMWMAFRGDHQLANEYRATLATANGSYFAAHDLKKGGATVGDVFGYQGSPSWILVVVKADGTHLRSGTYRVQAVRDSGHRVSLGSIQVRGGEGSMGRQIPNSLDSVSQVRLLGPGRGGQVLEASFAS